MFWVAKRRFLITHGKSKETLHCRAHLAHYASLPQKGIPVKIFQRPSPVSAMAWLQTASVSNVFYPYQISLVNLVRQAFTVLRSTAPIQSTSPVLWSSGYARERFQQAIFQDREGYRDPYRRSIEMLRLESARRLPCPLPEESADRRHREPPGSALKSF